MTRVSDTRQRTREAATQLVTAGKRPHEITVDLIYAEIQQGSRTTINDELKAWKDERTKVDALGADLPPVIADSMRSLWVAAVEQGEQVFLGRRTELETALECAQAREAAAVAALETAEAVGHERIEALQEQSLDLQRQLTAEAVARKEAQGLIQVLQEQLTAVRVESAHQLEVVRQEQDRQATEFQATVATRDAAFRTELDTATQRLESVQANMLQQIDDARQAQRRAEGHSGKLQQQNDQLQSDLTETRMQNGLQGRELKDVRDRLNALVAENAALTASREGLVTDLATARGRLETTETMLRAVEFRATTAEARVVALAEQRSKVEQPEATHGSKRSRRG